MAKRRIVVLLPEVAGVPIGGYKVHYQLANALATRGYAVTVIHTYTNGPSARSLLRYSRDWFKPRDIRHLIGWFTFHPSIRFRIIPWSSDLFLTSVDVLILTSWWTSVRIRSRRNRRVFQIVYDYELYKFAGDDKRRKMARSLSRRGIERIATSKAVADMLDSFGSTSFALVPPGVDLGDLAVTSPIEGRERLLLLPLRPQPSKGAAVGLTVMARILNQHPGIPAYAYGEGPPKGVSIPEGLEALGVIPQEDLVELYAITTVFIFPSVAEGWGLPPLEAMASGAAVVLMDNGGSADYAQHGVNCLVAARNDAEALQDSINYLLTDEPARLRLARAGRETALQFHLAARQDALVQALGM